MTTIYKTELDIANDILSIIQNIDSFEDARTFIRIYINAMQVASKYHYNENQILNLIGEVDQRFA